MRELKTYAVIELWINKKERTFIHGDVMTNYIKLK